MKKMLLKFWPILVLLGITLLLFATNYSFGTRLIGWDNLMTEFNLKINFQRSIFAVWQEYQSLGLLGGMGHASDLIHVLSIFILSFVLPNELLRYSWTFLMLFAGGAGAYFLLKNLIFSDDEMPEIKKQFLSLSSATFYLLNLATMQTFYVPFEAFVAHFAALPWLLLSTVQFHQKPNRNNCLLFIIILILAMPQAYIPTLFVVYALSIFVLFFILFLKERQHFSFKSFFLILGVIFAANAAWLLPFAYFTLTNSSVALAAKINQMSTQTVFLQNQAFGNIRDVILLKGFWFNNVDPNFQQKYVYMLLNWRNYLNIFFIQAVGYLIFTIVLVGIVAAFIKRKFMLIAFAALFAFAFTMLTTNTFPFSFLNQVFRLVPLFGEAFRFPFTKFSILLALTYSIFFAVGIEWLSTLKLVRKINFYVFLIPFFALIVIYVAPVFSGNLLYIKDKLKLPQEYTQTFNYFNSQDPNVRIANFPQQTFWGWQFYDWGYGGSGFLWYGIKQPILDRAFDVWSKTSENYYWEMAHAVYAKNAEDLNDVLNKYQIGFLLFDKNIINPPSPQTLMNDETQGLLKQLPNVKKDAQFGNIIIYKVNLKDKPNNFVFVTDILRSVNQYAWGEYDQAYKDLGNYVSSGLDANRFYPLRSLFSAKNQEDEEFKVKEKTQYIEFNQQLPDSTGNKTLFIPDIASKERTIYGRLVQTKINNVIHVNLILKTPEIYLSYQDGSGNKKTMKLYGEETTKELFIINQVKDNGFYVNVDGAKSFKVDPFVYEGNLGSTFLLTNQDNVLVLSNKALKISQNYVFTKGAIDTLFQPKSIPLPAGKDLVLVIDSPKIDDGYQSYVYTPSDKLKSEIKNCDNFNHGPINTTLDNIKGKSFITISAKNATACFALYTSTFIHDQGYITFIDSQNVTGRPIHFWLLSENENYAPIDTYLNAKKGVQTSTFILSPQEQFGNAYSFHFENASITNDYTINNLGQIKAYSLPYSFLNSIYVTDGTKADSLYKPPAISVSHPNESLYRVSFLNLQDMPSTLVLSQSFDKGWGAYRVSKSGGPWGFIQETLPFIFGQNVKNHILVNNWENGWVINDLGSHGKPWDVILIYLPQYLEYLGFIILLLLIAFVVWLKIASRNSKNRPS